MERRAWIGHLVVTLAAVVWGFELFLIRYLENPTTPASISPEMAGLVGYALCTVLLAGYRSAPWPGGIRGSWRDPATARSLLVIGLVGAALNWACFFGLRYTTSANAGILQRTDILFTLLLSLFLVREPIRGRDWGSIAVMVVGVGMVIGASPHELRAHLLGDSMLLLGAFLVSLNAVLIQRCLQRTDSGTIATANSFCITLGFLAMLALTQRGALSSQLHATAAHGALMALLGFVIALVFVLYYIALGLLPLWEVRIFMLMIPVTAALFEAVFLGTRTTAGQAAGMAAVMGGAASISLRARGRRAGVPVSQEAKV